MGTVNKIIADRVIAGEFEEDYICRIVEYDNAFGGVSYGLEGEHEIGRYQESEFVRNPRVYWERGNNHE